jgi:thiol-disulfide isomerase/thioredoxin
MKLYFLLAVFCFSIGVVFTQTIKIKVKNPTDASALLSSLEGEKVLFIDSISSINKGEFQFNLSNIPSGIYRLSFSINKWIVFIYDNEEVEIETDANNISENLKVIKSESNKIYYDFVKLNKAYKTKTELLQLILSRYPKEDNYYQATREKLTQIQDDYLNFVNITSQANPKSFIARYVRSSQLPVIDTELPLENQLKFLKSHALDNVNFYDRDLIYSDAFANKTIEYLTYYRNPQLPLELLEKEFNSAVDTILNKAKVNTIVYQHIVEYLLDGFKKFGFDNVLNYIVENYVIKDDLCLDQKLTAALDKRIEQVKKFKVGATAPNIIIPDLSGSVVELNKIQSEKILIVFYASWCPHCQTLLPQINELYKNQKETKFEVLAISVDSSHADWQNFVKTNGLNEWMNGCDFKGWDGNAALDYFIYATPTMFLIDKKLKLFGMPKNVEEIINTF